MIGTYVLSAGYYDAYYLRAQKVRTLIKKDFEDCFAERRQRDPDAGDAVGGVRHRRKGRRDPIEMYLNDIFTVTVNMAGLPGISVPAGMDRARSAARPATDRTSVRRGDAVLARRGDRAGGGPVHAARDGGERGRFKASLSAAAPAPEMARRSPRCGGPPRENGTKRTILSRMKRRRTPPGSMPICIASKATWAMPLTGTGGRKSRLRATAWKRNGSGSHPRCSEVSGHEQIQPDQGLDRRLGDGDRAGGSRSGHVNIQSCFRAPRPNSGGSQIRTSRWSMRRCRACCP